MLVEIDSYVVLTDPIWSERDSPISWIGPKRFFPPPLPISELPELDAVVISHDHYDHLDEPTVRELNERAVTFYVPLGVGAHLEHWKVPADRIVELGWWEEARVGELALVATPTRHFSGRSPGKRDTTLWASWTIIGPEHRVFFSGDTGMFSGFAEIGERYGPFDVTMIESGAYNALWADSHLGPEQALQAHEMLRGELMIPIHWGTFELALHSWIEPAERLIAGSRQSAARIAIPKPGQSIDPYSPPAVARWWPPAPWETADQAPVVSSGLAHTASPPITASEPVGLLRP
jgi:L-ascorbate metabolism protein UlaG (beta-lactamase superfamily)